jgi:hypothetical protein
MGPLAFLALVVVISVVGTLVLWARNRPTTSAEASISEFNAKLKALSGEGERRAGSDRRRS